MSRLSASGSRRASLRRRLRPRENAATLLRGARAVALALLALAALSLAAAENAAAQSVVLSPTPLGVPEAGWTLLTKVETSCDRILIAGGANVEQNGNKGRRFDRAFKEEAVRLLQTSGRRQRQIAGDLGISVSALGRWVAELREEDLLSGPHEDAAKEITRLRRERDLARQERDLLKKSAGLLRQGKSMRFRFIDAERAGLAMPIFRLCRLLQVSVSGFYAWRNRGPSQRQLDDMVLLAHVRAAFRRSRESYGAERVHHELTENGIEVGRHRVARLMRGNGLSPKRKQKFKKTTDSQHNKAVASNLLDQNFSAEAPNEKWAADISYIWTAQGWLYLAVMLDLYSRRVIGWAVGARMTSDLPLRALNRAIGLRQPGAV